MNFLENHIEAFIFVATEPIRFKEIKVCLCEMLDTHIPDDDIQQALDTLLQKYDNEKFAFKIFKAAGGYQFQTKSEYHTSISLLLKQKSKKQLSKATLETLAIIAYRQPITKGEIEKIRGIGSDYAVQKLLEKELIMIKGKADTPGRPVLYGTSDKFMEYFGMNSLDDLPQAKDFAIKDEDKADKDHSDGTQGNLSFDETENDA